MEQSSPIAFTDTPVELQCSAPPVVITPLSPPIQNKLEDLIQKMQKQLNLLTGVAEALLILIANPNPPASLEIDQAISPNVALSTPPAPASTPASATLPCNNLETAIENLQQQ
ncbi:unnamed protein product [Caenorhabditis brenneri]